MFWAHSQCSLKTWGMEGRGGRKRRGRRKRRSEWLRMEQSNRTSPQLLETLNWRAELEGPSHSDTECFSVPGGRDRSCLFTLLQGCWGFSFLCCYVLSLGSLPLVGWINLISLKIFTGHLPVQNTAGNINLKQDAFNLGAGNTKHAWSSSGC